MSEADRIREIAQGMDDYSKDEYGRDVIEPWYSWARELRGIADDLESQPTETERKVSK